MGFEQPRDPTCATATVIAGRCPLCVFARLPRGSSSSDVSRARRRAARTGELRLRARELIADPRRVVAARALPSRATLALQRAAGSETGTSRRVDALQFASVAGGANHVAVCALAAARGTAPGAVATERAPGAALALHGAVIGALARGLAQGAVGADRIARCSAAAVDLAGAAAVAVRAALRRSAAVERTGRGILATEIARVVARASYVAGRRVSALQIACVCVTPRLAQVDAGAPAPAVLVDAVRAVRCLRRRGAAAVP